SPLPSPSGRGENSPPRGTECYARECLSDVKYSPSPEGEGRGEGDLVKPGRVCRVEFQNVSFEYQAGRPVLKDISFVAEPGQSVALVGHTGSGKTTVVALLQKFYLPTAGHILVDGQDLL